MPALNQYKYEVPIEHSFAYHHPEMIKEWHVGKNFPWTPETVSYGSAKVMWWICPNGHEYKAVVCNRHKGNGVCRQCKSVSFVEPDMMREWDYTKNTGIDPTDLSVFTNTKVWWKCSKGHEWKTSPATRHQASRSKKSGCPYCSPNPKVNNENCLATKEPELASEWAIDNLPLTPEKVTTSSRRRVWWECSVCHKKWQARVKNRTEGNGCPSCSRGITLKDGTYCDSLTEAFHYLTLKSKRVTFLHNKPYPGLGKSKFDFFIPDENKYIEVTGFDPGFRKWACYKKNVDRKREHVESVLKAKFEFICFRLNRTQLKLVRSNSN